MLSGTHEDMQHIQAAGKLDEWCNDNLKWLQDTFGKDNVVSAVLHMDEKTPHIHATVVPIVTGERRKVREKKKTESQEKEQPGKRKYRKKSTDTVRLCADDVMTRKKLEQFQNSYAEKMQGYGLGRGIKGSDARHISTPQYYRELYAQNEDLKEDIAELREQKQEVYHSVRDLYDRKDEARQKFRNMDKFLSQQEKTLAAQEERLQQFQKDYEPYKSQDDMNMLFSVFPKLSEFLRMSKLCKSIGLTIDDTQRLSAGETVLFTGELHTEEHQNDFEVQDAKLQVLKDRDVFDKLHLRINGKDIQEWFKEKLQELKQAVKLSTNFTPRKPQNKSFKR